MELRRSRAAYRRLLLESRGMERQLRLVSHQVLSAQEEERRRISRELHDQIAQLLAAVNIQLATLNGIASLGPAALKERIRSTQQIVETAVGQVHGFACELRPPVLDDLGLIPAFHSHFRVFTARTGIRIRFTVSAGIESLSPDKRAVLYRVMDAALTNVETHAGASEIVLTLMKSARTVTMVLADDGRAFDVARVLDPARNRRLGIIGMKERVEMVGGKFRVDSVKGRGTTIHLQIPSARNGRRRR